MRTRRSIATAVVLTLALATTLPAATRDTTSGIGARPDRPSIVAKARLALERVLRAFSGTPTVPIP